MNFQRDVSPEARALITEARNRNKKWCRARDQAALLNDQIEGLKTRQQRGGSLGQQQMLSARLDVLDKVMNMYREYMYRMMEEIDQLKTELVVSHGVDWINVPGALQFDPPPGAMPFDPEVDGGLFLPPDLALDWEDVPENLLQDLDMHIDESFN